MGANLALPDHLGANGGQRFNNRVSEAPLQLVDKLDTLLDRGARLQISRNRVESHSVHDRQPQRFIPMEYLLFLGQAAGNKTARFSWDLVNSHT